MPNVLLITSSPRGEASYSTQIATELAHKIKDAQVVVHNLWRDPLPHIDSQWLHAVFTPENDRTPEQREALTLSDSLIAELKAADIVIVGSGMINFGIPSVLKSWVDYVTRKGMTFSYSEAGAEGLVTGKRVVLVLATGGVFSEGPIASMNHQEPHLRTSLGFLGLTDIEAIRIEGVALGAESTEKALAFAREKVETVARSLNG